MDGCLSLHPVLHIIITKQKRGSREDQQHQHNSPNINKRSTLYCPFFLNSLWFFLCINSTLIMFRLFCDWNWVDRNLKDKNSW